MGATWNPNDTRRSTHFEVYLGDSQIFGDSQSSSSAFSETKVHYSATPFDRRLISGSKTYGFSPPWPLPDFGVTVSGSVHAQLAVDISSNAYRSSSSDSGVGLDADGRASLYGRFSGSADIVVAAGGVDGYIDFVTLGLERNIHLDRDGSQVQYNNVSRVDLKTLDGYLDAWGRVLWWEGRKRIATWDGFEQSYYLVNRCETVDFSRPAVATTNLNLLELARAL